MVYVFATLTAICIALWIGFEFGERRRNRRDRTPWESMSGLDRDCQLYRELGPDDRAT